MSVQNQTQVCPNEETLRNFLEGKLLLATSESIAMHVEHCDNCARFCESAAASGDQLICELRLLDNQPPLQLDAACEDMLARIAALNNSHSCMSLTGLPDAGSWRSATEVATLELITSLAKGPTCPLPFGRYLIEQPIGQGGMATVYKAFDSRLDRYVALKIPHRSIQLDPLACARFQQEARAAASLTHAGVCGILDSGQEAGLCFLTMPLLHGETLERRLKHEPCLTLLESLTILCQLCDIVDAVHAQGVLHRDIKPANVFLTDDGEVILMDFGIALSAHTNSRLTQVGLPMGTPAYLSPEQASGDWMSVGCASDIYSLGILMYEILSGHPPYQGSTGQVIGKILHTEVPAIKPLHPEVNERLIAICHQAIHKDPKLRYPNAAAMSVAIRHWVDSLQSAGATKPRRYVRPALLMAAALSVLVAGGWLWAYYAQPLEQDSATSPKPAIEIDRPSLLAAHKLGLSDVPSLRLGEQVNYLNGLAISATESPFAKGSMLKTPLLLRVSENDSKLITLHEGPSVVVWGLESTQIIQSWTLPKFDTTLTPSVDGKMLWTAGGGWTLRQWKITEKQEEFGLSGHSNWINTIAVTTDNRFAVTSSKDGSVRAWDLQLREALWIQRFGIWMRAVDVDTNTAEIPSPDSQSSPFTIVAGANDGVLHVLDGDGNRLKQFQALPGGIVYVRFAPTGDRVACADVHGNAAIMRLSDEVILWKSRILPGSRVHFHREKEKWLFADTQRNVCICDSEFKVHVLASSLESNWQPISFLGSGDAVAIHDELGNVATIKITDHLKDISVK